MNRNRRIQAAAITLSAGIIFAGAGITAQAAPLAGATTILEATAESDTADTTAQVTGTGSTLSGVNRVLATTLSDTSDELDAEEEQAAEDAEAKAAKYGKLAIANVSDYANVRKHADAASKLVGHIYDDNLGHVIATKGDWVKIESGDVTGWVKKEYLTIGSEDAVKKAAIKNAVVNTTTLKVRKSASKDGEVLDLVPGGSKLKVVSTAKADDGWIKVKADDDTGYVAADYVTIKDTFHHAKSIKAIKAAQKKAEVKAASARVNDAAPATTTTTNISTYTAPSYTNTSSSSSRSYSSSSSSSSSSSYSGSSSGSGSSVVNYATQFVGNPYVWGGTSLTGGADCSGFVMSVYRKFGVSLPHSSSADRSVGKAVSKSNMQAGDIVCYSGHVAIYMGNGKIVHASNKRDGIKISNANYRNIVAVRRVK